MKDPRWIEEKHWQGAIAGSLALSRHPELVIALFVGLSRSELLSSWIRLCGRQKEKREGED